MSEMTQFDQEAGHGLASSVEPARAGSHLSLVATCLLAVAAIVVTVLL